jgi:hypothetical protein
VIVARRRDLREPRCLIGRRARHEGKARFQRLDYADASEGQFLHPKSGLSLSAWTEVGVQRSTAGGLRASDEVSKMHGRLLIVCSAFMFATAALGSSPAAACDCGGYGYGAPAYGYYGAPSYGYNAPRTYSYYAAPTYDDAYDDYYDPPVYAYAPAVNQYSYAAGYYGGSSYNAPAASYGVRRGYVSAGDYGRRRGYVSAGYVGARRGVVGASYYNARVARVGGMTRVGRVGRVGLRR